MIRGLVQTTLDTALYPNIKSYWQRKSGKDCSEYIVYTMVGDTGEQFADDASLTKNASVTIKYYYRSEKIDTDMGRQAVESREDSIESAMINAGFVIPNGKFDAGDIDDIGFYVTVFECEYWRVA